MNEVVKYKNELNTIPMRSFNAVELDLFFSICSKMKEKSLSEIRFDFEDLKELSNYKPTSIKRFADDLESVYKKMLNLTYREHDEEKGIRKMFVIFTGYEINENEKYVDISINPKFEYILNELSTQFTQFELREFTQLNSSYSKAMYRLLKQYKKSGFYIVKIEDFRELLDVPKSYQSSDIDKRVLKPITDELSQYFKNLKIIKEKKKGRGRGGVLIGYKFKFEKEKTDKWVENKYDKPKLKKETLPNWANQENQETEMSEDEKQALMNQLKELRNNED